MKQLNKKLREIEKEINDIEAYNYSDTTKRIMGLIESAIKEAYEQGRSDAITEMTHTKPKQ